MSRINVIRFPTVFTSENYEYESWARTFSSAPEKESETRKNQSENIYSHDFWFNYNSVRFEGILSLKEAAYNWTQVIILRTKHAKTTTVASFSSSTSVNFINLFNHDPRAKSLSIDVLFFYSARKYPLCCKCKLNTQVTRKAIFLVNIYRKKIYFKSVNR